MAEINCNTPGCTGKVRTDLVCEDITSLFELRLLKEDEKKQKAAASKVVARLVCSASPSHRGNYEITCNS